MKRRLYEHVKRKWSSFSSSIFQTSPLSLSLILPFLNQFNHFVEFEPESIITIITIIVLCLHGHGYTRKPESSLALLLYHFKNNCNYLLKDNSQSLRQRGEITVMEIYLDIDSGFKDWNYAHTYFNRSDFSSLFRTLSLAVISFFITPHSLH